MKETLREYSDQWVMRWVLLVVSSCVLVACIERGPREGWELEPTPPESTVNANLCRSLVESSLKTSRVREVQDAGGWRIEYPAFKGECGVYQLDAVVESNSGSGFSYKHEISVCNRCETSHTWNYLYEDIWSPVASTPDEGMPKKLPLPKNLDRTNIEEILFPDGGPVVGHKFPHTTNSRYEVACKRGNQFNEVEHGGPLYWALKNSAYVSVHSGSTRTFSVRRDFEKVSSLWLNSVASEDGGKTTIRWPRLFHRDFKLTGAHAASAEQFCAHANELYGGSYYRPFAKPYRPDLKYATQRVKVPNLPTSLVETLKQQP